MIDLFLSNNRIAAFLEQKKNQTTANTRGASLLLEAVMSPESGHIATFWLKDLVDINLKMEDTFWPGTCKVNPLLRNLG